MERTTDTDENTTSESQLLTVVSGPPDVSTVINDRSGDVFFYTVGGRGVVTESYSQTFGKGHRESIYVESDV